MMIKSKFLTTILSIFLFLICGIGFAESEIPHVFKYSLSTRNKHYQHSAVFNHSKHAMEYKITCADCHHQLEPGDKTVEESCIDCHGSKAIQNQRDRNVPKAERVRPYQMVLHDMCIECHKEIKANHPDVRVPVACWRCHMRSKR